MVFMCKKINAPKKPYARAAINQVSAYAHTDHIRYVILSE